MPQNRHVLFFIYFLYAQKENALYGQINAILEQIKNTHTYVIHKYEYFLYLSR